MLNKCNWSKSVLAVVFAVFAQALHCKVYAQEDVRVEDIVDKITKHAQGFEDVRADITMVQRSPKGNEKIFKIRSYTIESGANAKNIVVASFPPDMKRYARLAFGNDSGTDDLWYFQPHTKRVKRMAPQENATYLMGTELTMEDWDITQPQSLRKYNLRYLSTEACGEHSKPKSQQCYKIERIPKSQFSGYSRQIVWLDAKLLRLYRVDFYDLKNVFLKTLRFDDYRQYANKYWRPSLFYVVNKQTGGSTRAIWTGYKFGNHFSKSAFSAANLDRYAVLKSSLKEEVVDENDTGTLTEDVQRINESSNAGLQSLLEEVKSIK